MLPPCSVFVASLVYFVTTLICFSLSAEIKTVLRGKSVEISCFSSFSPPWTWYSRKDNTVKSLALSGTTPHPKLNEPRYRFYQKSENEYLLEITTVKEADAGKFICDGDTRTITTLNVIRSVHVRAWAFVGENACVCVSV